MKNKVIDALSFLKINKKELGSLIEIPAKKEMGDYAFPCFILSKSMKKNPSEIAKEVVKKIDKSSFEKVEPIGPYVNFFIDRVKLATEVIKEISKKKDNYGKNNIGNGKKIVIEMSSPNIAKPFGVGHLRSTIIGNSLSLISDFSGYKPVKINYLGDWGTQFGKLIFGYKKFGNPSKLKKDPIKHLLEIYVKANKKIYEDDGREWFKKLENGDKGALKLWKEFRELSLKKFNEIYVLFGVKFDETTYESQYNGQMEMVLKSLEKNNLLEKSDGAMIVNLEKYGLGIALIKKSDGTTLYATRDIAAAIARHKKYNFAKMIYEVGGEQKLHFEQFFKILELMGHTWAKNCVHVDHGLYLGKNGKKFATRKGDIIAMEDVFKEVTDLAKKEISKRGKISDEDLEKRARKIAIAAVFYGDLKNHRTSDIVFDIKRFLSFDGNTGPYLLYSYARAKSILKKADKTKNFKITEVDDLEKKLIFELGKLPEIVNSSHKALAPNIIANYAYSLSKTFSEFYHNSKVIGSDKQEFRLKLVWCFTQTIKNALRLLGIDVVEKM